METIPAPLTHTSPPPLRNTGVCVGVPLPSQLLSNFGRRRPLSFLEIGSPSREPVTFSRMQNIVNFQCVVAYQDAVPSAVDSSQMTELPRSAPTPRHKQREEGRHVRTAQAI